MGIHKDRGLLKDAAELRCQAEERLQVKTAEPQSPRTGDVPQGLVHEFEVQRIELETALEKYRDLYDFAPVGYLTLGRKGAIRAVNLTGAGLLGIERSRLIDRRFGLFVTEEQRPAFSAFLDKVFTSRGREVCEVSLATEGINPLFVQVEAVADAAGKECRIAVIDITERRRAEDALTEKRRELEELNSSLEARIARAVDELRQKDQLLVLQDRLAVMGEMINNIAHQWRQPLNTLGLLIQQLPLFYDSDEFSREFLEKNTAKVMQLVQHMSRTIDSFRSCFRSDKEAITFGANRVIEQTVSLIEKSFADHRISIALQPEGDPLLSGYPNEYAQVLLNILMNARDALVNNNVADARICVHSFAEGATTIVTVSDNAGGIADEIMDRIFEPYFTTKGPDKGTGIGLFMSKSIIEKNMGGRLTVRNIGNGAEFRIEV